MPSQRKTRRRLGAVAVMFALMLIPMMGLLAVSLDYGYAVNVRIALQAAADSAALAGGTGLRGGLGYNAPLTAFEARESARQLAVEYAAKHRAGDVDQAYADGFRDIRFGNAVFNPGTQNWDRSWGAGPYNLIGVSLLRNNIGSTAGDGPLPLFFAPFIGTDVAQLSVQAEAVLLPVGGFRVEPGSGQTASILPFAIDKNTWDQLQQAQAFYDQHGYVARNHPLFQDSDGNQIFFDDHQVSGGQSSDGTLEANFYPDSDKSLPSGNRGTVDLGAPNNSTSDLARQILHGLNERDLSYFPNNELVFDEDHPLWVNADPGISAGMKDELASIIGKPRVIPVFSEIGGKGGNNAMFKLINFQAISIVKVKLTGKNKTVLIQPTRAVASSSIADLDGQITDSTTVFHPLILIN